MRAIRVTSAALLGVAALAMTAPAAHAADDDSGFWRQGRAHHRRGRRARSPGARDAAASGA